MERLLTYAEAIREATELEMARDPSVIVLGLGVDDFKGIYGTTKGLVDKFGPDRVIDTPLSEDGMTGVAIGAALAGLRPIHVHIRMDFVLLAMNQLINMAAKSRYMSGGVTSVPLVVRVVIGRSWGQGGQHSQGLHSFFMHVPGLRVVAPTSPHDAKGCLMQAIRENDPVVYLEHRMLHGLTGVVPAGEYTVPLGRARVVVPGEDLTIVAISHMVVESLRAHKHLAEVGISAEVIDAVSLSPIDFDTITASVQKTGRLLVVDTAWLACGAGSEIVAGVVERLQYVRELRVRRLGFAPVTCPTTRNLEDLFYPSAQDIASAVFALVKGGRAPWTAGGEPASEVVTFKGPF